MFRTWYNRMESGEDGRPINRRRRSMKNAGKCQSCKETCWDQKALPCQHLVCKKCLNIGGKQGKIVGGVYRCPACENKEIDTPFLSSDDLEGGPSDTDPVFIDAQACDKESCSECGNQQKVEHWNKDEKQEHAFGVCMKHHEQLEKYCTDCKELICILCLTETHQDHKITETSKITETFRDTVKDSSAAFASCAKDVVKNLEDIDTEKNEFFKRIEHLREEVNSRREELKSLVDDHSDSLLLQIGLWEDRLSEETDSHKKELERYLDSFEKYKENSSVSSENASPNDMLRILGDLDKRNDEILRYRKSRVEHHQQALQVYLKKTKVNEFLEANSNNIVGVLGGKTPFMMISTSMEDVSEFDPVLDDKDTTSASYESHFDDMEPIESHRNTFSKAALAYEDAPSLVQTLRTKPAKKEDKGILGLTVLDDELYVVSRDSCEVEIFDCKRLIFSCELDLEYLENPEDITSCDRLKCLYIMDRKHGRSKSEILRVDRDGNFIRKWSTRGDWGHLSVTADSNVVLAVYKKHKFNEYTPLGDQIRVVLLSPESGFAHPRHVIKLTGDQYIVSHGEIGDVQQRVVKVNANGEVLGSFGDCTNEEIKRAFYLVADDHQFILVADTDNSRVLVLSPTLELKRELLNSEKHGLRYPVRIALDKTNGLLFVADNQVGNKRISVFQIN